MIPRQGKTVDQLGSEFGSYCAAWEDGACSSESCESRAGPGHTCGTLKECKALWPEDSRGLVNFDESQSWCCDAWCYVDPKTCTDEIQVKMRALLVLLHAVIRLAVTQELTYCTL